ncbi:MAG: hypothetical protein U9M98_01515 [Patescibacteria group bacterium]|nr:hypothetical protein [Patescibacteria group bacterium]
MANLKKLAADRDGKEVRLMGKRFKKYDSTGVLDALLGTGRSTTVEDTKTGNRARAWGRDRQEADRNAWDKLESKQGPPPSKR